MMCLPKNETIVVSIHAPTGGATNLSPKFRILLLVSIHAPTGGATFGGVIDKIGVHVSIHAPTGGATRARPVCLLHSECFNPRSHGGSDP